MAFSLFLLALTLISYHCCIGQKSEFFCSDHLKSYETDRPVGVESKAGPVTGKVYKSGSGFEASVFQGIPYATQQRFQHSALVTEFATSPLDATQPSPICYQFQRPPIFTYPAEYRETEDCLRVTIVKPHQANAGSSLPVIIWIHGGSYLFGFGNEVGLGGIIDNYVARGVVFVTVQYRMGPLGFLYSDKANAPVNMALYDQNNAIQFVIDNIAEFGGDPTQITLFGESAGAASVSLQHSFNPSPRVRNSMAMSGAQDVAMQLGRRESSRELATAAGCPTSVDVADCLRNTDMETMQRLVNTEFRSIYIFGPVPDGRIVPSDINKSLMKYRGNSITGTTTDEFSVFNVVGMLMDPSSLSAMDAAGFKQYVADEVDRLRPGGKRGKLVARLAYHQYLDAAQDLDTSEPVDVARAVADMGGDTMFQAALRRETELMAANAANNVWLYEYAILRPGLFLPTGEFRVRGPWHLSDLVHAFAFVPPHGLYNMSYRFDSTDCDFIDKFSGAIVNLAKTGDPRGADGWPTWPKLTAETPDVYLRLDAPATVEEHYRTAADAFWNKLVPDVENGCY